MYNSNTHRVQNTIQDKKQNRKQKTIQIQNGQQQQQQQQKHGNGTAIPVVQLEELAENPFDPESYTRSKEHTSFFYPL